MTSSNGPVRPLNRLESWLERPSGSTVTTILLLLTGGWASIRTTDIQCCVPFRWDLTWGGVAFWVLAAASGYLFFVGQRAKDLLRRVRESDYETRRAEQRAESERVRKEIEDSLRAREDSLRARLDELGKIMRTMPPENFIENYAVLYLGAASITDEALRLDPVRERDEVVARARRLLRTVAVLAKTFDGDHDERTYGANIMVYRTAKSVLSDHDLLQRVVSNPFFFREEGVELHGLEGVLILQPEFSATSDVADVDGSIQQIVLPIPHKRLTPENKYLVVPGAGVAYADRKDVLVPDSSKIGDWCRDYGDFRQEFTIRLQQYFTDHPVVSSFASLVLLPPDGWLEDVAPAPLGVVNVHANEVGLLRGSDRAFTQFVSILRPVLRQIARLWLHLHPAGTPDAPTSSAADAPAARSTVLAAPAEVEPLVAPGATAPAAPAVLGPSPLDPAPRRGAG